MSSQTTQLLEAFELRPEDEKRTFTAELLCRAGPFDSEPLNDDETAYCADSLFAMLDKGEHDSRSR